MKFLQAKNESLSIMGWDIVGLSWADHCSARILCNVDSLWLRVWCYLNLRAIWLSASVEVRFLAAALRMQVPELKQYRPMLT